MALTGESRTKFADAVLSGMHIWAEDGPFVMVLHWVDDPGGRYLIGAVIEYKNNSGQVNGAGARNAYQRRYRLGEPMLLGKIHPVDVAPVCNLIGHTFDALKNLTHPPEEQADGTKA